MSTCVYNTWVREREREKEGKEGGIKKSGEDSCIENGEQGMKGRCVERGGGGGRRESEGGRKGRGRGVRTLSKVTTILFVVLISPLTSFIDT